MKAKRLDLDMSDGFINYTNYSGLCFNTNHSVKCCDMRNDKSNCAFWGRF
jgi:hypothetical protein